MCGLCGSTSTSAQAREQVARALADLRHRGPDGDVIVSGSAAIVGHTRLAIVDLEGGAQPFCAAGGRIATFFNGEIYNHRHLRARHGLVTSSECDGAVIPPLWERFGPDSLDLLRGMYALCVIDERDGTTTLAVDPLGMKPLYWGRTHDGSIRFASELSAVAGSFSSVTLDRHAIAYFLEFGRMPLGASGVREITRMRPGEWLRFSANGDVLDRGMASLPQTCGSSWSSVVSTFVESVELHLRADVPMGLMLSSGVDSTAIAWAAAAAGCRAECFTVAYRGSHVEADLAATTATSFGHGHTVLEAVPDPALIDEFLRAVDRPTIDGLNTFLVCRAAAAAGLKVIMNGTGGDELLLGYPHHVAALSWDRRRGPSSTSLLRLARVALKLPLTRGRGRLAHYAEYGAPAGVEDIARQSRTAIPPSERRRLLREGTSVGRHATPIGSASGTGPASQITVAEFEQYLMPQLLADGDTFSMANSVEARMPFVDAEFVAAIAALRDRRPGKGQFVAATGDPVLAAAATRPKVGFTLPMDGWMREGPLSNAVATAFARGSQARRMLGADRELDALGVRWQVGRSNWTEAWAIVSLDQWLRKLAGQVEWM